MKSRLPRWLCFGLTLSLSACMDSPSSTASSAEASTEGYHSVIRSKDHQILVKDDVSQVAGRVITYGAFTYSWPANQVITVSIITSTSYNGGVDPSSGLPLAVPPAAVASTLDTALRAWTSLVNPDGPNPIVFKRLPNNDASAMVKLFWNNATGTQSEFGFVQNWYSYPSFTSSYISVYGNIDNNPNWYVNQAALYHVLVHLVGHMVNVGDNPSDPDDVMYQYYTFPTGTPATIAKNRYFGENVIQTINLLYNGGFANNSPYMPVFISRTSAGYNTNPILGWADAKTAVEQGKWVLLQGLVGKPDNANLTNKVYPLQATNGSLAYWNTNSVSSYNTELAGCEDIAQSPAAGALFSALPANSTHAILETRYFNGLFTSATNQILWGTTAPYACQRQLGDFYTLRSAI